MFLPPTTALGAGLYSISIYGGLLLFSGFLLYDTQRIIRAAEVHPVYAAHPFDPVNA
jgi:FtsH-binding integral membrane protein